MRLGLTEICGLEWSRQRGDPNERRWPDEKAQPDGPGFHLLRVNGRSALAEFSLPCEVLKRPP